MTFDRRSCLLAAATMPAYLLIAPSPVRSQSYPYSGSKKAQWLHVLRVADEGFELKRSEVSLSGQELLAIRRNRYLKFRKAAKDANTFIARYFDNSSERKSEAHIHCRYAAGLFYEHQQDWWRASTAYQIALAYLDFLSPEEPEPTYNGVVIRDQLPSKIAKMASYGPGSRPRKTTVVAGIKITLYSDEEDQFLLFDHALAQIEEVPDIMENVQPHPEFNSSPTERLFD